MSLELAFYTGWRPSPLCPSFSLSSLIPYILCRPIKHGRNRGIERGGEAAAGGERHSSRLFKYRGCAIRSVCCPARVSERASERANDWADQRINVGGLGWLIASWFDCRPPLLSPKLAYCTPPWQYSGYLHTGTARVYQRVRSCTWHYLPVRDVAPRHFYVINAPRNRAMPPTALFLFLYPYLYFSLLPRPSRQLLRIIVKESKRSCPLEFLRAAFDEPLIRLVASGNFLYYVKWIFLLLIINEIFYKMSCD